MTDDATKSAAERLVEMQFGADVPTLLRQLYVGEGLSQAQVAVRLGVSRQSIVDWMKRHEIPTRDRRAVPA